MTNVVSSLFRQTWWLDMIYIYITSVVASLFKQFVNKQDLNYNGFLLYFYRQT